MLITFNNHHLLHFSVSLSPSLSLKMGLRNSRLDTGRSRLRVNRSSLSSLLCGASSSRASRQMEEQCENSHQFRNHRVESLVSVGSSRTGISGSNAEVGVNLDNCFESGLRGTESSSTNRYLSEFNELNCHRQVSDVFRRDESSRDSNHRASTSSTLFTEQQSSETVSVNGSSNMDAINAIAESERNSSGLSHPSPQLAENLGTEVMAVGGSGSVSYSADQVFTPTTQQLFGSGPTQGVVPSGLGFLVSNRERTQDDDGVLHLDVLSISSDVLSNSNPEGSNREARRNSRRMFWDAFSRRSSRRLLDSPTVVFSLDDNEEIGSRDGWVFGLSSNFFDDGNGSESGYIGGRFPFLSERRRHSRAEVWERLRGGLDENGTRRNSFCPSGLHPDGACSCESLLIDEESSTRASISRIVMLAEALFEVLDEIHRQPVSLSLSMVSSPAPASVVDSFPLKSHSKFNEGKSNDDAAECYICLAEYEEGDKIRVLPCHHEYHMSCVDKWLKEIHGVCPLCRGDVREGLTDCSVSKPEIPSSA